MSPWPLLLRPSMKFLKVLSNNLVGRQSCAVEWVGLVVRAGVSLDHFICKKIVLGKAIITLDIMFSGSLLNSPHKDGNLIIYR